MTTEKITAEMLDELSQRARESERLRMNLDMRNSPEDQSQRMLNALEPGTKIPIHRHEASSETTCLLRGRIKQNIYSERGSHAENVENVGNAENCLADEERFVLVDSYEVDAKGDCPMYVVPQGVWHNTECLESGTIIFEAKDGPYVAKP